MLPAEAASSDKVRGEVVAVVYDVHVRQLRKNGQWCVTCASERGPERRPARRARRMARVRPARRAPRGACVTQTRARAVLRRLRRAARRRPAAFDVAAEAEDAAAYGGGGAGGAGGGEAAGGDGEARSGSGSDSDDGLPPLEENCNRRHERAAAARDASSNDSDS